MHGVRGMPRGTPDLVPIAWCEVEWDGGAPYLDSAGGAVAAGPLALDDSDPYGLCLTTIRLSGAHDPRRLHVQVSSQASGYAHESRAARTGGAVVVVTEDDATPFALLIFEER